MAETELQEVDASSLEIGALFDGELYLDKNSAYMINPQDVRVNEKLISTIKKWQVKKVYCTGAGKVLSVNTMELLSPVAVAESEDDEIAGRDHARRQYISFCGRAHDITAKITAGQRIEVEPITNLIKEIIAEIKEHKRFLLRFSDYSDLRSDYYVAHAVETAIISLVIGEALKMPPYRLINLGISAFLHEIGLTRIPRDIHEKEGELTDAERNILNTHVLLGFRILREAALPAEILEGVLQHHERVDGSGYMQGLVGDQISQFAKIIGIACSYHAQIARRPFRDAKDQHAGLVSMLKGFAKHYDEALLNILVKALSIYPIGSGIKLNDGSVAIVVDSNPDDARYPYAKLLCNGDGVPYPDTPVVLLNATMRVVSMLTTEETRAAEGLA